MITGTEHADARPEADTAPRAQERSQALPSPPPRAGRLHPWPAHGQ